MRSALLALALLLAGCSLATPFVPPADLPPSGAEFWGGGDVLAISKAVDRLIESGDPYVAPAVCASSCTMLLKAPNVCWRPKGTLRFHSASLDGHTGSYVDLGNKHMASYYPPALRRWFLSDEGPGGQRSTTLVDVPVADLNTVWGANVTLCPGGRHPDA